MTTALGHHAAALTVSVLAGLTGLGISGGPAFAVADGSHGTAAAHATAGSHAAVAVQAPQSAGFPRKSADYADQLVTAWGRGDASRVKDLASQKAIDALTAHGDRHVTAWHRVSADSGADPKTGSTTVAYVNVKTDEVMTVRVDNVRSNEGDAVGVRQVRFHN